MKYKSMIGITAASFLAVSCNNEKDTAKKDNSNDPSTVKKEEKAKPEAKPVEKPVAKPEVKPETPEEKPVAKPEVTPSTVSGSIATVAQVFDGEKYVSTELSHKPDYFIIYFTASW